MIAILLIILAVFLEIYADYQFKKSEIIIGLIFYTISSIPWAYSLSNRMLSKSITIFAILNLVLGIIVGVVFFEEKLSIQNKIGILLGIISIFLIDGR